MGDPSESLTPSHGAPHSRALPIREDCWSEEATSTLVDSWGSRYLELNRGNLRQKDWQDVADAVNALHGHTKKTHRTDVQCKNRIDTIKKKYKIEKARIASSDGSLTSPWPFFDRMDSLIGSSFSAAKKPSPSTSSLMPSPPMAVPLRRTQVKSPPTLPIALPQKRPASEESGSYFKRNFSVMAAAAAAESDSEEEDEAERESEEEGAAEDEGDGIKRLARAIEHFGEVYQRVESEKLRQMVDLEKQRMKFAKDLEMERMRIFAETQIQLLNNFLNCGKYGK